MRRYELVVLYLLLILFVVGFAGVPAWFSPPEKGEGIRTLAHLFLVILINFDDLLTGLVFGQYIAWALLIGFLAPPLMVLSIVMIHLRGSARLLCILSGASYLTAILALSGEGDRYCGPPIWALSCRCC